MASRLIAPQQARGEEGLAVEGVKAQKNMEGEVRNRRALNDIGNFVTGRAAPEGKLQPQITRPITRSFGAQLLAKAQGGAVIDNNKKKSDVAVNGAQLVAKKAALPL